MLREFLIKSEPVEDEEIFHLTYMKPEEVSVVDAAANKRKLLVIKSQEKVFKAEVPDTGATSEEKRDAQKQRSATFDIEALEGKGENLTYPKGDPTDLGLYGDPVNLKYPLAYAGESDPDLARANNARARFKQAADTYEQTSSKRVIHTRIVRAQLSAGASPSYNPDDELDKLLASDIKDKLTKEVDGDADELMGVGKPQIGRAPDGDPGTWDIQSLLFSKDEFSLSEAKTWLTEHDSYKNYGMEETDEYYRFRQYDPEHFSTCRMVDMTTGIKAVYCKIKQKEKSSKQDAKVSETSSGTRAEQVSDARAGQRERSGIYEIEVLEGKGEDIHLLLQQGENDDEYADPVNRLFRLSWYDGNADPSQVASAVQEFQSSVGLYEQKTSKTVIMGRIIRAAFQAMLYPRFESDHPLFEYIPEDLKAMVVHEKAENKDEDKQDQPEGDDAGASDMDTGLKSVLSAADSGIKSLLSLAEGIRSGEQTDASAAKQKLLDVANALNSAGGKAKNADADNDEPNESASQDKPKEKNSGLTSQIASLNLDIAAARLGKRKPVNNDKPKPVDKEGSGNGGSTSVKDSGKGTSAKPVNKNTSKESELQREVGELRKQVIRLKKQVLAPAGITDYLSNKNTVEDDNAWDGEYDLSASVKKQKEAGTL